MNDTDLQQLEQVLHAKFREYCGRSGHAIVTPFGTAFCVGPPILPHLALPLVDLASPEAKELHRITDKYLEAIGGDRANIRCVIGGNVYGDEVRLLLRDGGYVRLVMVRLVMGPGRKATTLLANAARAYIGNGNVESFAAYNTTLGGAQSKPYLAQYSKKNLEKTTTTSELVVGLGRDV
jgi:hypothetical protein